MSLVLKLLRSFEFPALKAKFIIIYLLNVSDIILTLFLLDTGFFNEGNLFMKDIVRSQAGSVLIKTIVPLLLISFILYRMKEADERQLKIGNFLINCCLGFYLCINILHFIWIVLYNKYII